MVHNSCYDYYSDIYISNKKYLWFTLHDMTITVIFTSLIKNIYGSHFML